MRVRAPVPRRTRERSKPRRPWLSRGGGGTRATARSKLASLPPRRAVLEEARPPLAGEGRMDGRCAQHESLTHTSTIARGCLTCPHPVGAWLVAFPTGPATTVPRPAMQNRLESSPATTLAFAPWRILLMCKTPISSGFRRSMHQALFSYVHTDRERLFKDRTFLHRNTCGPKAQ